LKRKNNVKIDVSSEIDVVPRFSLYTEYEENENYTKIDEKRKTIAIKIIKSKIHKFNEFLKLFDDGKIFDNLNCKSKHHREDYPNALINDNEKKWFP